MTTPSLKPIRLQAGLFAMLIGAFATPIAAQETVRLSLEHYMDMETVSGPQISPDGSRVVYTRAWFDMINDRRQSSVWTMDADGSKNRHLLDGGGVQWSPDGTRILFTAPGEPGGTQVHVRWMDAEGASSQITRLQNGPSNVRWSPDGNWIAFTSRVDAKADFAGVSLPDRPDGATWTTGPKIVERAGYKRDRSGYVDTGWTHLFMVPAEGVRLASLPAVTGTTTGYPGAQTEKRSTSPPIGPKTGLHQSIGRNRTSTRSRSPLDRSAG